MPKLPPRWDLAPARLRGAPPRSAVLSTSAWPARPPGAGRAAQAVLAAWRSARRRPAAAPPASPPASPGPEEACQQTAHDALAPALRPPADGLEAPVGPSAEGHAGLERLRQLEALLETACAVPFEYDPKAACFVRVGPQGAALLGLALDHLSAAGLRQRLHPGDLPALERLVAAHPPGGGPFEFELHLQGGVGGARQVRGVASFGPEDEPPLLRGLLFDVTERHRLEAEGAQARRLESLGRLASGVAHELNTPIQYINDSVCFIHDGWVAAAGLLHHYAGLRQAVARGEADPSLADALTRAEEEADLGYLLEHMDEASGRALDGLGRVTTIVRSLKSFARPDAQGPVAFDVNEGLRSTLAVSTHVYQAVAEVETELGEVPRILGTPSELNQVFLHLLQNAAHAVEDVVRGTGQRGVIRVESRLEADAVVVSISDTGTGISEAARAQVFEPFFTTKPVGQGTGQGLAEARAVLARHHGEITFTTELGRGTTFTLRLPLP